MTASELKIELTAVVSNGVAISIECIRKVIISSWKLWIRSGGNQRSSYAKRCKTRASSGVVRIRTGVSNGLTNTNNNLAILTRNWGLVTRVLRVVGKESRCISITVSRENRYLYTWCRCINTVCKCKFWYRNCKNCNKRKRKRARNSLKRLNLAHKSS